MPATATLDAALSHLHVATRTWFDEAFAAPTGAQRSAWPEIASGKSTLLLAPTGSGKTLAAFLASLDKLMFAQPPAEPAGKKAGIRVLYISPLKALGVDVDRNLRAPIAGITAVAGRLGEDIRVPRVGVRSGDTTQKERQEIVRNPPEILITTPESLYLMMTSKASSILASVETVILDEIHVMVPTKRGVHLFATLERLERFRKQSDEAIAPLQRIGLSATQRPLDEIARLMGGAQATANPDEPVRPRPVQIVDASEPKKLELRVEVPVEDMARQQDFPAAGSTPQSEGNSLSAEGNMAMGPSAPSIWPAVHQRLLQLIRERRSTMIFVNSRRLAERMAAAINELASEEVEQAEATPIPLPLREGLGEGEAVQVNSASDQDNPSPNSKAKPTPEIAMAHHGSIAKEKRAEIEDRLKRGQLPAIVATSSLELGIDMGAVDLVVQIEAPPTIASGIQRIGRAGHQVGAASNGVIFPKFRGDLLACSAATGRMLKGHVEETYYPRNPLDILAQQIVAMASREPISVDEVYATLRGAAPYADLPRGSFEGVLDLLSGRYPSDEFAELRPRLTWDRLGGTLSPRRGTQRIAILNGGTIPDRGLYGVFLAGDGPDGSGGSRVGELDEEMVFETRPGDVFLLGASSWRALDITKDRVIVAPAPGEPGKMPFWRGEGPGRPLEFGRAIGKLTGELVDQKPAAAKRRLTKDHALDPKAAENLIRYLTDQAEATGQTPSDASIVIESFLDEIGDWRVCILSPFGARVHAPWAMAVAARLKEEAHGEVDLSWTDDGLVFRLPESPEPPPMELFLPRSDEVEELVTRQLGSTALFAARFRENAARALLLPRRQPNRRTPLWLQRRKSADLLAVASRYPSFPILLETYRECLRDVFDLPGLVTLLKEIEQRKVRVVPASTTTPSPFASSLLFNYIGNYLYEGDAPLAERRAAALSLDHAQLRELLGSADLRELLDGDTIAEIGVELQRIDKRWVRDEDGIHELLLQLGTMTRDEVLQRCDPDRVEPLTLDTMVGELLAARRVIEVRIGGEGRLAAAEDAGRLRDALGVNPPTGLPDAFLEHPVDPLGDLVSRYARTHGPFTAGEVAWRLGLGEAPVTTALTALTDAGRLVRGEFTPGHRAQEWCDAGVLRTIKRRSLAKLRKQVEAVPQQALARFLPVWQGIEQPRRGLDGLLDVVEQLQGTPLPASTLEQDILAVRVLDYRPGMLDELCHAGELLWQGVESLGPNDGRIALYLTDRFSLLGSELTHPESVGELSETDALRTASDDPSNSASDKPSTIEEKIDPLDLKLYQLLNERGALFFDEITRGFGGFPNDILESLWRLVWRGLLTNDTLAPLRSVLGKSNATTGRRDSASRRRMRGAFRSRHTNRPPGSEGRWSLIKHSGDLQPTTTERQTAFVTQLLERYGVVTRNMVTREQTPGGFAALYPILKAMEEAGKVRRGYFVEGLGGAQFAAPGADELLRSKPKSSDEQQPQAIILAATDPANAYGAALSWPESAATDARPQRSAGANVILADGKLLGYLGRTGRSLITFLDLAEPEHSRQAKTLAETLAQLARNESGHRAKPVLLAKINGEPAEKSPLVKVLNENRFNLTSRGILHRGDG